ncbi:unnamed protein product [Moneuplotes crassus]|uniref:Uncharacterized protein n=1 Tax=Euplotes crassus TaxID=5936 RepID=A0AAD1XAQ8_EUPCR|nr:unnamed protein product [Moneuplotes crassus]
MFGSTSKIVPTWENNKTTEPGDTLCEKGPEDSITAIRFSNSPNLETDSQFISCSSWDETVKIWEISSPFGKSVNSSLKGSTSMDASVLSHCWSPDNTVLFGACVDSQVKMWDIGKDSIQQVGVHDSCVKDICFCEKNNLIISTGWDGHMKFWDLRSSTPVFDISVEPAKIWSFSYCYPLMVGLLSDNTIFVFDIDKITKKAVTCPDKISESPLKYQNRCVEVFPDAKGYIVSSIAGRCGVVNIDFNNLDATSNSDFKFKCHRVNSNNNDAYAVHQISFNKKYSTFATCGGDGNYFIWDKKNKKRLKTTRGCDAPITACKMNDNASMVAYSFGYDWSKGYNTSTPPPVGLFIHPTTENEIKG